MEVFCHRPRRCDAGASSGRHNDERIPRRRGAAALELALLLPLLLTIILGVIDFGRFAHTYVAVTNAARAGAAYAAEYAFVTEGNPPAPPAWWTDGVHQAVVDEIDQLKGFDANHLVVNSTRSFDGNQPRLRVQVTYQFDMVIPWPLLPNQLQLTRSVFMRGH